MPRPLRILLGLAALAALGFLGAIASVYHWANGVTPGALALSSLAFACALALVALGRSAARRPARIAIAVILTVDAAWAASRITRPSAGAGPLVCEARGACDRRGRAWQRVIDEHESARFGLYLSMLAGSMRGAEAKRFEQLLDSEYARLPESWRGLPNALLLRRDQRLQWLPEGKTQVPCLVFLHGFGGQLSLYLHGMVGSELGREVGIVAPVLDNFGIWWSAKGMDLVSRTLDDLPEQCDTKRVVLVGVSNGAIGASAMLAQPKIRSRLAATVLLSGAGSVNKDAALEGARVLAIAGRNDPRIPLDYIERQAVTLRAAGADVEVVDLEADHFLLLTHAAEWTHRVYLMGTSLGRASSEGIGSP